MSNDHLPGVSSRPASRIRATTSSPLLDVQIYRPSPWVALGLLVLPVVIALAGAAVSLNVEGAVPKWLPFTLLLWVPGLPLVWLGMKSVKTSSGGIAVGRPWDTWAEMPWQLVERAERRGALIQITDSSGVRVTFTPLLLREGGRLKRQLFLRLPAHVFAGSLANDSQGLLLSSVPPAADGSLSGTLHAQPRAALRVGTGGSAVAALAGGALALLTLPPVLGIALALLGATLGAIGLAACFWLFQVILMSEKGVSVISPVTRHTRSMPWEDVELIEHSSREALVRLRGKRRLSCAGPALLSPADRDLMRAFLHRHSETRGVPIVPLTLPF
jgi:hypothetical protein